MRGDDRQPHAAPGQVPHLPHHGERHAGRGRHGEHRRHGARQRFVDANPERHELERHRDDAVEPLERDRLRERGCAVGHQPLQREEHFDGPERMEDHFEAERAPEACGVAGGEAEHRRAQLGEPRAPPRTRAAPVVPRAAQQPHEHRRGRAGCGERPDDRPAPRRRQRHGGQDDRGRDGEHRQDRRAVDQVLDGERRQRVARGEIVPGEKDLGRLARQQAERCDAADGIAGEKCAEGARIGEPCAGRHAQPPARRADHEAEAGERQDGGQAPADALDAVEDVADAGALEDIREERRAAEGAGDGQETPAGGAHTCRRDSTCFRVSSMRPSLSSLETCRCRIFEAIATDRSTASWRICCTARAVSS